MTAVWSGLAARTAATWLTLVATVAFTFAARAMLARVLGPVGIGTYALMLSAGWLGGTALSVGLPAYNASFAARQSASVLLANSILWNLVAFVVVTVVCAPLLLSDSVPAPTKAILVGVVMSPFTALLECTRGLLQGTGAIAAYNWLGLTAGAINFGLIGMLVATGELTLVASVMCWMASTAISVGVAVLIARARIGRLVRADRGVFVGSLKFGSQAWLSQLTGIVNFRVALLLTQVFLGTATAGIYAVAMTIAETLFYFPNALAVVTISRYATATPAQALVLLKRSAAVVAAVSATCAVIIAVAGGFVIVKVFGAEYSPSMGPLLILLPGVVSYTPIAVSNWYFNAHLNKPWVNLVVGLTSAIVGSLLAVLWARPYGLAGIAWATTTGYVSASVLNLVLVRIASREDRSDTLKPEAK